MNKKNVKPPPENKTNSATLFFKSIFLKRNNRVLTSNVQVVRLNTVNADTSTVLLKTTTYLIAPENQRLFSID